MVVVVVVVLFTIARMADKCRAYMYLFYSYFTSSKKSLPNGLQSLQCCTHSYSACIMAVNPIFSAISYNPGQIPEFWD